MPNPTYFKISERDLTAFEQAETLLLFTANEALEAEPCDIETALRGIIALIAERVETIRENCEVKNDRTFN